MIKKAYKKLRNNVEEDRLESKWFYKNHTGKKYLSSLIHTDFRIYKKTKKKEKLAAYRKVGFNIGKGIAKGLEMMVYRYAA